MTEDLIFTIRARPQRRLSSLAAMAAALALAPGTVVRGRSGETVSGFSPAVARGNKPLASWRLELVEQVPGKRAKRRNRRRG